MYTLKEYPCPFGGLWSVVEDEEGRALGYFLDEAIAKDFLDMLEGM
jgi:hypothetical protein